MNDNKLFSIACTTPEQVAQVLKKYELGTHAHPSPESYAEAIYNHTTLCNETIMCIYVGKYRTDASYDFHRHAIDRGRIYDFHEIFGNQPIDTTIVDKVRDKFSLNV